MQVTTKGQITIPQDIREMFGFLPYAEVDFHIEKDKVYLVKSKKKRTRGGALIEKMRGKGDVRMTTDEILALTRK